MSRKNTSMRNKVWAPTRDILFHAYANKTKINLYIHADGACAYVGLMFTVVSTLHALSSSPVIF